MIEILPDSTDKTIGFKISGKVAAKDYDILLPKLNEGINTHGKINLLVRMENSKVGLAWMWQKPITKWEPNSTARLKRLPSSVKRNGRNGWLK